MAVPEFYVAKIGYFYYYSAKIMLNVLTDSPMKEI